ncbi:MAG: hypothetical protein AB7Q37_18860 [Pyrinomonadaceae bacterium]
MQESIKQTDHIKVAPENFVPTLETKKPGSYWTADYKRGARPYRAARINENGNLDVAEFEFEVDAIHFLNTGERKVRDVSWLDELTKAPAPAAEPEPAPSPISPSIAMVQQSFESAQTNTNGAAVTIADKLVPEFGNVLEKGSPSAIAYGFPPAVDTLIKKAKLTPEQTDHLLKQFSSLFTLSSQMRNRVEAIEIRSTEDAEAIDEAKECHRILRDERLNAEKRKKVIKEPYLRPSQLIDGVFRLWMDEIGPIEKLAKDKAEYIENLEKERKAQLARERLEKLKLFDADGGSFDLGEIDDAGFELIYQGAIASYNARKAEEQKAEQERLERERAAEAERQRLQAENSRLERERAEAAARAAEQQRIADEERRQREEAEAKIREQEDARRREEARLAAIEEAKRLAPEKEKIAAYFRDVQVTVEDTPELASVDAIALLDSFRESVTVLVDKFKAEAERLGAN